MKEDEFQIVSFGDVAKDEWETFVGASDTAWMWHRHDLIRGFSAMWGENHSFLLQHGPSGRVLAVLPLYLRRGRALGALINWPVGECLGGIAYDNSLPDKTKAKVALCISGEINRIMKREGAGELWIRCASLAPAYQSPEPKVSPLLDMGFPNASGHRWTLNLQPDLDSIWNSIQGRTDVRKAEKEGITIREGRQEDLNLYYRLHSETYSRSDMPPHSRAYFEVIFNELLPKGIAMPLFAEKDGSVLAVQNFAMYKGAGLYWTGASSEEGKRSCAGALIQWRAIEIMKERKFKVYESGEAFPGPKTGGKTSHLSDFKRKFSSELSLYFKSHVIYKKTGYHLRELAKTLLRRDA